MLNLFLALFVSYPAVKLRLKKNSIAKIGRFFLINFVSDFVPPKIKELIEILEAAGFINKGGKGSHRNYKHLNSGTSVTVPGKLSEDAKHYLVKAIKLALEDAKNENK